MADAWLESLSHFAAWLWRSASISLCSFVTMSADGGRLSIELRAENHTSSSSDILQHSFHEMPYGEQYLPASSRRVTGAAVQMDFHWYLVRTKPNRERYVKAQLADITSEVFLPLLSMRRGTAELDDSTVPLFPQYIFLRCNLTASYFQIRYAPGVVSFVTAGYDPLPVAESIVECVRARCTNNVVHLDQKLFQKGDPVQILSGPFRGLDAVFERYLSGAERVAILLNAAKGYSLRVIASARSIAK